MISFTRLKHLGCGLSLCIPALLFGAHAGSPESLQTVGQASFHVGWIHVYDAELRAVNGEFDWNAPFELELTYGRNISEKRLIDSTLSEMARHTGQSQSNFDYLKAPLDVCFSDVKKGDQYIASRESADAVVFSLNGTQTCTFEQPDASRLFFGIWLSDQTRSDKQSKQLRGLVK